jgi:preprotein translocase subunit YajC
VIANVWIMTSPDGGGNPMGTLFMLAAFFAILYFLLIRPQRQQQKAHQELVAGLKRDDEIATIGGIVGKIIHLEDDRITIKTADDTRVEIERSKVARRMGSSEEA